jgi:hypothetical protein
MIILIVFEGDKFGPNAGKLCSVTWLLKGTENDVVHAQVWANKMRHGRPQVYCYTDDELTPEEAHAMAIADYQRTV